VETPGGGRHFYVAGHPELASAHNLSGWPGVDIQSFGALVYLPGTQRPKYGGAGYTIISEDVEALADGGDPDGAEALAGWVAELRGTREEFEPSEPWDGKPLDQRQNAYLDAVLRGMYSELAAMQKDSGRNTAVYNKAMACGNYIAGAGLNEDRAIRMLLDASNHNGLINEDGERAVLASIHSGIRNGKTRPRAVPSRRPDDEPPIDEESADSDHRRIVLTRASDITPRRVAWLWDGRIAIGTLALLAGREGLGKSILAYTLAALITRGMLPGEHLGAPKSVLVAATEDSWSQTIVPRLIAAGADRDRVYRVEVIADDVHTELTLPRDLVKMRNVAREVDAVLLILDPLLSRLDDRLDTHKDADVRRALEPLVAAADIANLAVLGLIHHNKSGSSDPLQVIMGSKAFAAVARSVHTVIYDPDDDSRTRRLFGTPKNNLGRSDLPTLSFTIDSFGVQLEDGNDPAWTGQLVWGEGSAHSIHDAMERAAESGEQKSAATDAQHWLEDYLTMKGGICESAKIKKAAVAAGHTERSLRTARSRLRIEVSESGFPRHTWWSLPGTQ
jgi:AAA domain